jgi:transposase-like protein
MTVSLVARRHGVAPNQLFTWRRLVVQGALTAAGSGEQVVPASITGPCRARCASSNGCSDMMTSAHRFIGENSATLPPRSAALHCARWPSGAADRSGSAYRFGRGHPIRDAQSSKAPTRVDADSSAYRPAARKVCSRVVIDPVNRPSAGSEVCADFRANKTRSPVTSDILSVSNRRPCRTRQHDALLTFRTQAMRPPPHCCLSRLVGAKRLS